MIPRAVTPVLLILLSGLVFAQSKSGGTQPPAISGKNEGPQTPPPNPVNEAGAPIDPASYVIGAEDVLSVRVWREADFTNQHTVRPDGKITLPLVGDMQAAGLTPERLSSQMKDALSKYINEPDVTVTLVQVNSKKYFVAGLVNRPGPYPLVVPTKIFDALNSAGGFQDFANKKDVMILRGDQRLKFNYNDFVKGKKLDQNVFLENGDTILVK